MVSVRPPAAAPILFHPSRDRVDFPANWPNHASLLQTPFVVSPSPVHSLQADPKNQRGHQNKPSQKHSRREIIQFSSFFTSSARRRARTEGPLCPGSSWWACSRRMPKEIKFGSSQQMDRQLERQPCTGHCRLHLGWDECCLCPACGARSGGMGRRKDRQEGETYKEGLQITSTFSSERKSPGESDDRQ